MHGGILSTEQKMPSSLPRYLVKVASHIFSRSIRRPSRFLLVLLFGASVLLIFIGSRNSIDFRQTASKAVLEIHHTAFKAASQIKPYIPSSVSNTFGSYEEDLEDFRWDDDLKSGQGKDSSKKPKFHLLITAKRPTPNLCKTLLSAAVLNYPPPTLVTYGATEEDRRPGADIVHHTYSFLKSKEVHRDDLVLVVEEDSWFQLPADVTINRFFHSIRDSNKTLLQKYGRKPAKVDENSTDLPVGSPKYIQKVLFGAQKQCSNPIEDPACYNTPQSPLPQDIYGEATDKVPKGKYNPPRYMGSTMAMGHVYDLRTIYKHASEMLEYETNGIYGSQYVFSQIFGEQEYVRSLQRPTISSVNRLSSWISSKLSHPDESHQNPIIPNNMTVEPGKNYEFGIGLDYIGSIFQILNNSAEDVRFVTFSRQSFIDSPSKLSEHGLKSPIHLPLDLNLTSGPFAQHIVSSPSPNPPLIAELDDLPKNDVEWKDVELATNILVPSSSVPATLSFHGSEDLRDKWWESMWYVPHARALLRQYVRSPDGPIAAKAAAEDGERWWDLRGGKGGVWTDKGEWLEWNEICGGFENEVFGDGRGRFGEERGFEGQSRIINQFGKLVAGKEEAKPDEQKEENFEAEKEDNSDEETSDEKEEETSDEKEEETSEEQREEERPEEQPEEKNDEEHKDETEVEETKGETRPEEKKDETTPAGGKEETKTEEKIDEPNAEIPFEENNEEKKE